MLHRTVATQSSVAVSAEHDALSSPWVRHVTRKLLGAVYSDTVEAVAAWLDGKPVGVANREVLQRQASTGLAH
jgi:hypothetical protein